MKWLAGLLPLFALVLVSCQKSEVVSEFTGNEMVYALQPGSSYAVSGTITFKERKDGSTTAVIALTGTDGNAKHPVHVHLGDIAVTGADVAALLSPVEASSGRSETVLTRLADDTRVSYQDVLKLSACIKIHQSDTGPGRDVILAAGNIGQSYVRSMAGGRFSVGLCESE
ncbi:MAG: hypothetical protein U0V64_00175 [Cyclobacteriaceae bacterium]